MASPDLDLDLDIDIPDGDSPDDLLASLMEEFGDGTKPSKPSKRATAPTYFPPAPRWTPVAIALRTIIQRCTACGEEHTYTQGVFLESHAIGTTATRWVPFIPEGQAEAILALPRRKDITYEQTSECDCCFGFEDKLLSVCNCGSAPQLSLNLGD